MRDKQLPSYVLTFSVMLILKVTCWWQLVILSSHNKLQLYAHQSEAWLNHQLSWLKYRSLLLLGAQKRSAAVASVHPARPPNVRTFMRNTHTRAKTQHTGKHRTTNQGKRGYSLVGFSIDQTFFLSLPSIKRSSSTKHRRTYSISCEATPR